MPHTEKGAIRNSIAQYYLAFSAVQMLVLALIMGHSDILVSNLSVALVSAAVYLLIGNRIFSYASSPVYNTALTVFIALYGVIVLIDL